MKQLGEVWRSCTKDNVEADESYFVLNSGRKEDLKNIYIVYRFYIALFSTREQTYCARM